MKDCPVPYCRVCRQTGHVSSEECHNRRETYAERVAASATMNADDDADHDDGMQDGQLLESGTQSWSEMAEQQSSEMMPTDPPVCAGDSMPVISADYSSDDDINRVNRATSSLIRPIHRSILMVSVVRPTTSDANKEQRNASPRRVLLARSRCCGGCRLQQ